MILNKFYEYIFRYDQLVLKKFVAEAYAKLVDVDVKRLDIPERAFTGEKHSSRQKYPIKLFWYCLLYDIFQKSSFRQKLRELWHLH